MRVLSVVPALALAMSAGLAFADDPVATAKNAPEGGAPTAAKPDTVARVGEDAQYQDADQEPEMRVGFCGPRPVDANGKPDAAVHGTAGVAVGTRGYRSYHVDACKPLGKDGKSGVAISVTQSQINGRRY
jgi:hypothetical protein